uniref:Uncharacterized protein n=1 Tax=Buteo japonicus TaxID=224669 RepID=A0A8C0AW56_9AVES
SLRETLFLFPRRESRILPRTTRGPSHRQTKNNVSEKQEAFFQKDNGIPEVIKTGQSDLDSFRRKGEVLCPIPQAYACPHTAPAAFPQQTALFPCP